MNTLPQFPTSIYRYVRAISSAANRRICAKMASVPNCAEESLDQTLIEFLSNYSGPRAVAPGWVVKIDVHFLGGLRHFSRWEVGDIGVLIFAKHAGKLLASKVALLQSKRLYPDQGSVIELTREDFNIGIATLLPTGAQEVSLAARYEFPFTPGSKYRAHKVGDEQYQAIQRYEDERHIPVHYLFYNPWVVPVTYTFPLSAPPRLGRMANGGTRVAPAEKVRAVLLSRPAGYSPSFSDLHHVVSVKPQHASGWRLEHFMADLVMKCRQGRVFHSAQEDDIAGLFYRRTGPIAAAIAVTIEQSSQ